MLSTNPCTPATDSLNAAFSSLFSSISTIFSTPATTIEKTDVNLQGTNNYKDIKDSDVIIITAGVARTPGMSRDDLIAKEHSNVKVIIDNNNKALYFSRNLIPYGAKEFLYHIGIYGFRKNTLNKFVALPQANYEKNENLEQLRALENGMKIGVCHCSEIPISVDTITDLEKAQNQWQKMPR